jgi:hypothetical protein
LDCQRGAGQNLGSDWRGILVSKTEEMMNENPNNAVIEETEVQATSNDSESLPSLASVFNPEEFFDLDQIEDAAVSRMCCFSD